MYVSSKATIPLASIFSGTNICTGAQGTRGRAFYSSIVNKKIKVQTSLHRRIDN